MMDDQRDSVIPTNIESWTQPPIVVGLSDALPKLSPAFDPSLNANSRWCMRTLNITYAH